MTSPVAKVPGLVRDLYAIVGKLEAQFPGRNSNRRRADERGGRRQAE